MILTLVISSCPRKRLLINLCLCTYTGSNKSTIESLKDLFKEIPSDCDWHTLGLCLLKEKWTRQLNTIEKNNPDNAEKCCDEMLEFCLNSFLAVTWSNIIHALRNMNLDRQAEMIESDDSIKGFLYIRTCT